MLYLPIKNLPHVLIRCIYHAPGSPKTMKRMIFTKYHYFSWDLKSTIHGSVMGMAAGNI